MACALFEPLKEDSSFRWEEPLLEGYGSAKGKGKMVNFHADVHQSMKGKRFLCTADGNCDEAFDSIELLMGHMRVHHRPTRFFRCEKCEQKFNTNRSLFKHLHVCLNHDEPGSVFGRRNTRATTGTTAAPPASIMAAPASIMAAFPVTAAAAGADIAAVPCGAEDDPLGTTIDPSAEITATATDVATAPPVADTTAAPVGVAAALPSDVTVAPTDAASEERRAVDEMPDLTCERAGVPPTLPPPPPPSPPLGLPSGLPMPKLKSSEQHEMPHLKLGPGGASNARRKRKRRVGRQGGAVEAPAEEAPSPVAVLLRPEASAAPTLKRALPSEDAMENSQGRASAVSDGSTEGASAAPQHFAPPRLSRSSDESGEDGAPARTSLSKRKSKKVGGNAGKSTVTTAGSVAPPPAPPHGGEESGDDGVITAVSKVGKKKGAGRMGDLILPAGAPHLDSPCRPSLGEAESGTGVAARTSDPKGKKKATSGHPDTTSAAHGGGADGGDSGTAQAGPPKRRRKAVGRGSETRSRVAAAAGKGAGKASTKTLLLKLRTDRAAGEETRWIREEARGDGSSCPGPALPPLLASQERGAAAVARDDASDRGCGALAMASGNTGASGTESPVADCDDRTPPPPASSPPPPPPPACPVSAGCRGNTRVASTRAPTAPSAACAARRRRATSTSTAASARRANSGTQFVPWDKTTGH
ncbi:uncharacterized protein LOC116953538 isoform X2 [Petromyzon marinus]|uniref:uncharacterized protein LOC116953538 isoform X2 n=1 Tax=Petromyzon marinus TaxID=7757 RepID=UPI003F725C9F